MPRVEERHARPARESAARIAFARRAGGASRGMHRRATGTAVTVRRSRLEVEASDRGSHTPARAQAEVWRSSHDGPLSSQTTDRGRDRVEGEAGGGETRTKRAEVGVSEMRVDTGWNLWFVFATAQ